MTKNIMPGYFYRISSLFFSKKIGVACLVTILLFIVSYVYYQNSHTRLLSLLNQHPKAVFIQKQKNADGTEVIVGLTLKVTPRNRPKVYEIMPYLGRLKHLRSLQVIGRDLNDEDLKGLPDLPDLQEFSIGSGGTTSEICNFTDEGIIHLTSQTGIRKLEFWGAKVRGPGLKHLQGFNQLKELYFYGTPLDDSGMPHIVANFPKLKRFEFSDTNVTIKGLMQLADLHWLKILSPPQDLMNYEATDLVKKAKVNAMRLDFDKAHLASMRKARAAGIEVMPYDWAPFQSPELIDEILRQRDKYFHAERIKIEALKKKEHSNTDNGWTSYPPKSF